ncbi:MAG: hypothetical protein FDZ69_11320, partial [Deltaproteobacteria bacterium]
MANENSTPTKSATQAIVLRVPPPGQTVVVDIQPNQVIEVPFDMAEANVTLTGDDLRIEFPGNAVLILNDFAAMVDQGVSPLMMFADGSVVAGDVLLTALTAEVPETAAGPGGASGGAGEYRDDMGNLIDTVDRLGVQNPDPFAKAVDLQVLDEQLPAAAPPEEPPGNQPPVIGTSTANVSEEGLQGGIPDDTGSPDTTNLTTYTGQIPVSDPDGNPLELTLELPTSVSLFSGGEPVVWYLSVDGKVLTGITSQNPVVVVTLLDNAGNYLVELKAPIDHAPDNGENAGAISLVVTVSDGTASASGTLTVIFEDDSPTIAVSEGEGRAPALVTQDADTIGAASDTATG